MATGSDVVAYARTLLGDRYVFGAAGPTTFDCSGLVRYAYKRYGITTPRTTSDMMGPKSNLIPIGVNQVTVGDLILSDWGDGPSSHVAIYAGNNQVIEAPQPGENVKLTTLGPNYRAHVDALRRVPGIDPGPGSTGQNWGGGTGTGTTGGGGGGGGSGGGFYIDPKFGDFKNLNGGGGPSFHDPLTGQVANQLAGQVKHGFTSLFDVFGYIGDALVGIAKAMASMGEVAVMILRFFLPSNLLRAALFFFGTIFILIGIHFLAKEVREAG